MLAVYALCTRPLFNLSEAISFTSHIRNIEIDWLMGPVSVSWLSCGIIPSTHKHGHFLRRHSSQRTDREDRPDHKLEKDAIPPDLGLKNVSSVAIFKPLDSQSDLLSQSGQEAGIGFDTKIPPTILL